MIRTSAIFGLRPTLEVCACDAGQVTVPIDGELVPLLRRYDGFALDVEMGDGTTLRVSNIAWGYDVGDQYAHVTTNSSPFIEGERVDFFFTSDIVSVWDPSESSEVYRSPRR